MMNPRERYRKGRIALPFFILIAALLLGAAVQWLWNAILPEVADVRPISYWQAVGLFVLCKILFGSFRGPGRPQHRDKWRRFRRKFGPEGEAQSASWKHRWMNMTAEERLRFRQEMWERFRKPPDNI